MPSYSNNYSKWDRLELSDDSDIEGHPNVDKKSLIRWKQRDIHEKREQRKANIQQIENEIKTTNVLLPRIEQFLKDIKAGGPPVFSQIVERLRTQGSPDAPTNLPGQPTYDKMLESLLTTVFGEVKDKGIDKDSPKLGDALVNQLLVHVDEIKTRDKARKIELEKEKKEQARHITSEDLKEGFDSTSVATKAPEPEPAIKPKEPKKAAKATTSTIEVLNPSPSTASPAAAPTADPVGSEDEDDDVLPEMTPTLQAFSQIAFKDFTKSFEFIQHDSRRSLFVPGAHDALLLQAFKSEQEGKRKYAKQCVHQALVLQYCEKLGKDGVGLFFQRMASGNPKALEVFLNDVEDTYKLISRRAKEAVEEDAQAQEGVEQIQLVAENPDTIISFDVPDGPPPEHLILEGPGTEDLDVEEVRRSLQMRWDIYEGFEQSFKEALQSNKLENVNKVLGKMSIEEAENVVNLLQVAGILSFAEGGIRDETGKGKEKA